MCNTDNAFNKLEIDLIYKFKTKQKAALYLGIPKSSLKDLIDFRRSRSKWLAPVIYALYGITIDQWKVKNNLSAFKNK